MPEITVQRSPLYASLSTIFDHHDQLWAATPAYFLEHLYNDFDYRADDVWLSSYPRSGTAWSYEVLYKGQPEVVKNKGCKSRRRRLQGPCGRGTLAKARPPVLGMMQRGGQVVLNLPANVQQKTIEPFIKDTIMPGTLIYTDEYSIYARLRTWGYGHKSVNHGRGEFARDDDGDGVCEVHVHTMEGFWSLLRSWLRPHRGISQETLPLYLGFFEFVHNIRKRGKALLPALIEVLVT
jgi:transposase-like protein